MAASNAVLVVPQQMVAIGKFRFFTTCTMSSIVLEFIRVYHGGALYSSPSQC